MNTDTYGLVDLISVNAHSSIRIGGASGSSERLNLPTIYFDPFMLDVAPFPTDVCLPEPHDADIILITHDHYDHFSPGDIAKVALARTHFAVPASLADKLFELGYPHAQIHVFEPGETALVYSLRIEAVPAYNVGRDFHPKEKNWVGYLVDYEGLGVYVAGDTDAVPEAVDAADRADVVLLPVGGTYTMTAPEAAELINKTHPRIAVPTHYGSVVGDPDDGLRFAGDVEAPTSVRILIG